MAESPAHPETADDPVVGPGREEPPKTPRWVKISAILALIALVVLLVMLIAGGGQHGPGRHAPGGDRPQQSSGQMPGAVTEAQPPSGGVRGHTPPRGTH